MKTVKINDRIYNLLMINIDGVIISQMNVSYFIKKKGLFYFTNSELSALGQ